MVVGVAYMLKIIHSSLLTWRDIHMKHLKDRSHNAQNRKSGEISSHIFETYNISIQPHVCHIYNTATDIAMATIFTCTSKNHWILHCKYVLCCCDKCPIIVLLSQE